MKFEIHRNQNAWVLVHDGVVSGSPKIEALLYLIGRLAEYEGEQFEDQAQPEEKEYK